MKTTSVERTITDTKAAAARAREIVMQIEHPLGIEPVEREADKHGYDIEGHMPATGRLRFTEVKSRSTGAATITVTCNEILYSLNKPDDFFPAIVEFDGENSQKVHYVRRPIKREPDFHAASVNYSFAELLARAEEPR